jgi:hypothetical protein
MVVAVSYIQAVRRQAKVDYSFQLGKKSSQKEVIALESRADSLRTRLGEREVEFADSMMARDQSSRYKADSLTAVISEKDKSISVLKKKTTIKNSVSQKPADSEKRHRELLAYYKKRYEALPTDLTEYELKVAISEIRKETAEKYALTISEFNRIRETNQLSY